MNNIFFSFSITVCPKLHGLKLHGQYLLKEKKVYLKFKVNWTYCISCGNSTLEAFIQKNTLGWT